MTIQDWRTRIDEVDRQLVRLLSVRAQMAIEIGRAKAGSGMDVYDAARERDVLRQVLSANPGVLTQAALEHLFGEIVRESREAAARAVGSPETAVTREQNGPCPSSPDLR
jgi:chorismate mutase